MKNIAQKLKEARVKVEVIKTGNNSFGKYSFYQIDVIYAEAKKIFEELGIVTTVKTDMFALEGKVFKKFTLDVINSDNMEEKLTFDVIAEPNQLKGAQQAQEAGSDITYNVKYLFGLALMLDDGKSDSDATNTHGKTATTTPKDTFTPKSSGLSRTDIQNKIKSLSQDEQTKLGEEYMAKEGKTTPVAITYWKQDFLNEVSKRKGWA